MAMRTNRAVTVRERSGTNPHAPPVENKGWTKLFLRSRGRQPVLSRFVCHGGRPVGYGDSLSRLCMVQVDAPGSRFRAPVRGD